MLGKDRIIQLVRLILSSDKDGEILSAVYALQRTLQASGKSCHDLAETIAGKIMEVQVVKTKIVERIVQSRADADSWIEAADKLLATRRLADREREFVE